MKVLPRDQARVCLQALKVHIKRFSKHKRPIEGRLNRKRQLQKRNQHVQASVTEHIFRRTHICLPQYVRQLQAQLLINTIMVLTITILLLEVPIVKFTILTEIKFYISITEKGDHEYYTHLTGVTIRAFRYTPLMQNLFQAQGISPKTNLPALS